MPTTVGSVTLISNDNSPSFAPTSVVKSIPWVTILIGMVLTTLLYLTLVIVNVKSDGTVVKLCFK